MTSTDLPPPFDAYSDAEAFARKSRRIAGTAGVAGGIDVSNCLVRITCLHDER